jgi:VWFA-related protein
VAAWLAVLLAMPVAAPAQQPIRVDVNLVLAEVTVKDRSGQVVDGLKAEDFQIFEDGVEQQITHFSQDQIPLAVALVVDLSGSIEPFLRPLRYATLTALKALKREDQVALFTFTEHVSREVPLTRDKSEVSERIEGFSAGGGTNISRAVFEAAEYLKHEAPAARRVIVLISDNVHTVPTSIRHDRVVAAVLEADAAVYGLKVPGDNPRLQLSRSFLPGRVNVDKLAEATGGEVFDVEKTGSLYLAFEKLIERLKTRYTLGYYPTNKNRDGSFRKIDVKLNGAAARSGYTVLAKQGYYPPAAAHTVR